MKRYDRKLSLFVSRSGYEKMQGVMSGVIVDDAPVMKKAAQVLREAIEGKHKTLVGDPVQIVVNAQSNKGKIPRIFDVCDFHIKMLNDIVRHHYLHSRSDAVLVSLKHYFDEQNKI
jgi:hypothetical protein